jgi:predicted SAM-dependent methyltransferase
MKFINCGCGMTPIEGYTNFDNSYSIKIAENPLLYFFYKILSRNRHSIQFIDSCILNKITYADVSKSIPIKSNTVDVVYSSHMLEHLEKTAAISFLNEAKRVLKPGGIIRLCIPDLNLLAKNYVSGIYNADQFLQHAYICNPKLDTLFDKVVFLLIGPRHHQWMYDASSLSEILKTIGFVEVVSLGPGKTTASNIGALNLSDREEDSFYLEAKKLH